METNFIQMAASAGHAVAYTFGPIFKYIIVCVPLYFTNGFTQISGEKYVPIGKEKERQNGEHQLIRRGREN